MTLEDRVYTAARACLEEGYRRLRLELGIVSRISGDTYEIFALFPGDVFARGDHFPLDQTYCREVVELGQVVAHTEYKGEWGLSRHPLYVLLPLEAYLGAPIRVRGVVWGTVNFSSHTRRKRFSSEEVAYVSTLAERIGAALEEV